MVPANDLTWAGELTTANGPAYATEGLAWSGDRLYIAVNNAFDWGNDRLHWRVGCDHNATQSSTWERRAKTRIGCLQITANYHGQQRDYGSASLSEVATDAVSFRPMLSLTRPQGAGSSRVQGELKYQITGENAVRTCARRLGRSSTWLADAPAFYGAAIDPVSGRWYGSVTDYTQWSRRDSRCGRRHREHF